MVVIVVDIGDYWLIVGLIMVGLLLDYGDNMVK
jgi:hypothetical protein